MSVEMDEDDDFYAPEEPVIPTPVSAQPSNPTPAFDKAAAKTEDKDLEEGEEEDEGGAMEEDEEEDSDIDIITERKDGTSAAQPLQSKYSEIRSIPQRSVAAESTAATKPAPSKKEDSKAAADVQTAAQKSNFDAYAIPIHKPTGKPLTQVSIDEDLGEDAAPWRKPGTDISDYFNYGFDEFSWTVYAQKQNQLRSEYSADVMSQNSKKMMEDLNMMMMGAMPGAGPMPGGMPGMDASAGIPPEMQAMMQQMMASGIDPSQMDPASMFAAMQGAGPGGGPGGGGQGGGPQNFGGGQGFGVGQGQGYGFDQQQQQQQQQQGMGGRGGFRGRGGRRQW